MSLVQRSMMYCPTISVYWSVGFFCISVLIFSIACMFMFCSSFFAGVVPSA